MPYNQDFEGRRGPMTREGGDKPLEIAPWMLRYNPQLLRNLKGAAPAPTGGSGGGGGGLPLPSKGYEGMAGLPEGEMAASGAAGGGATSSVWPYVFSGGMGLLGNIWQGQAQQEMTEEQLAWEKEKLIRQLLAGSVDFERAQEQDQFQRDKAGLESTQQNPLAQQEFRQQQALQAALMNSARPYERPTEWGKAGSGGWGRIPEGGFDAETLAYWSPEARAAAEANFYSHVARVNPKAPLPDLGAAGYGSAWGAYAPGVEQVRSGAETELDASRARAREALQKALQWQLETGKAKPRNSSAQPRPVGEGATEQESWVVRQLRERAARRGSEGR